MMEVVIKGSQKVWATKFWKRSVCFVFFWGGVVFFCLFVFSFLVAFSKHTIQHLFIVTP